MAWDDVATTAEDKAWIKSFYPALMMNGTYKGKAYGIPFQRSTIVMYWNKEAFKEAGLDPEKAAGQLDRDDADGGQAREEGRLRQRAALGRDGALHRLRVLDVPGLRAPERPGPHEPRRQPDELRPPGRDRRAAVLARPGREAQGDAGRHRRVGHAAPGLHRRQDRDDVAHDGQPHRGEGLGQVPVRRGHAAGLEAARLAHRRRQLLPLQEDDARRSARPRSPS